MARRLKPYFLPELWITMGGRRLPHTGDGSRLGEESRDDGFEESERGDRGLMRGPPLPSSAGMKVRKGVTPLWPLPPDIAPFTPQHTDHSGCFAAAPMPQEWSPCWTFVHAVPSTRSASTPGLPVPSPFLSLRAQVQHHPKQPPPAPDTPSCS